MKRKKIYSKYTIVVLWLLLASCSATKFIPDNQYLLNRVDIQCDETNFNASSLDPYIRQHANSKWFSALKVPLGTYSLAGTDTTKWFNRFLQSIGEAPVVYDTIQARKSCDDLRMALQNMGYMEANVSLFTKVKGKKLRALYYLHLGTPYHLGRISYDIQDNRIADLLQMEQEKNRGLHSGMRFTVDALDAERKRITSLLADQGYYRFHKDFIVYTADSTLGDKTIDLTLHLLKYRANSNSPEKEHPCYVVRNVNFLSGDSGRIHLRKHVLENTSAITPGKLYSTSDLQKTYNNFGRLHAVRYTNIHFIEQPDSDMLDCNIQISTNKPSSISFQPEGTNTAGDLGAAASITYENKNLFRGSEMLSIQLRGAYENIKGLEGYSDQNYVEYSAETKLSFPKLVAPFLTSNYQHRHIATSELALSYNMQNRPEFHRRVFSTAWRYRWNSAQKGKSYRFDLIDLNYVLMPWISETFKRDYLDNESSRNAILRYNYEDLFIMKIGFGFLYNNGTDALRTNIETAGNILNGLSRAFHMQQNDMGQYTLFNIAYAQYAKFDIDYTRLIRFDEHNTLALHGGFGIAYPYGNSSILPYEKRYFSGGANSVRGWSVRELGPGKFRGTDGRIDFINQTGDMKLDLNMEYRTRLFWKLYGAAFLDAGNIWTLRAYDDQPGGQFKFNEFLKEIAVAYGLGIRLNFDYFILRLDMGMKAINPAYENSKEHYPAIHPRFSRDSSFHFAVGLPF